MPMKNPAHPGRIVQSACLEPLGLSVTAGAKILGVTRQTLTKVVNGKSGISPEMAIRLTKAFKGTPASISESDAPQIVAIDEEPFDSRMSETTRIDRKSHTSELQSLRHLVC